MYDNNDLASTAASTEKHAEKFSEMSLSARFEAVCEMYPDRVAVTCGNENVTYGALDRMANAIAGQIVDRGVAGGSFVAVWMERSLAMVAAMLGVLKAGCAYVPLDPGYPVNRITQSLQDAEPALLIANQHLYQMLPHACAHILLDGRPGESASNLEPGYDRIAKRDDLAYLMYTSGSTGKPKGVLVTHGNVLRLFEQTQSIYRFHEQDVWTMFHSFAFDFSVWELYGALLYGGRVVIVPFEVSRTPEAFYELLSTEKVTVLSQTPSAFRLLLGVEDSGMVRPLSLRYVVFGGEALTAPMLSAWFARHGEDTPQVFNMYGITETTVHVTCHRVTVADTKALDTPMGEPLGDLTLYLLDESGQPVRAGEIGELYVSGEGVAHGYHNRPVLTEERFLRDPFRQGDVMMYRSGDLARRREDGALVYAGRCDDQVKVNGFRIELGEIEAALASCAGVQNACVSTAGAGQEKQIVAYFVASPGTDVTASSLVVSLSGLLPPQMMPTRLVALSHMPLTANGKIDRKALPDATPLASAMPGDGAAPDAELSELEASVLALARETVGSQEVQIDGNFFAYGVESLQLTRFAVQARKRFGVKLTLRDLFEAETIADIAVRIEELKSKNLQPNLS